MKMGNPEVPSFTVDSTETTITFASPKSREDSFEFIAQAIRGKNHNTSRIVLICQQILEAKHLKSELASRNVNTLLLSADDPIPGQMLVLWTKGYIQQALILCDDMLHLLAKIDVTFVIHTTLPPSKEFLERLELLKKSQIEVDMLAIICHSEENLKSGSNKTKPWPEIEDIQKRCLDEGPQNLGFPMEIRDNTLSSFLKLEESALHCQVTDPKIAPTDLYGTEETASTDSFKTAKQFHPLAGSEDAPAVGPKSNTRSEYGVLACSRHPIFSCYDLGGVPAISAPIAAATRRLGIGASRAKGVQRFAWPHVSAGKSVIVVGNSKIGKTWCYLPTMCQCSYEELQRRPTLGCGPTSILLCPNEEHGAKIHHWAEQLLAPLRGEVALEGVVALWEKGCVRDAANRLGQPVGVLLTTVDLMLQLLALHSSQSPLFDARAVKHIALENLSELVCLQPVETTKLLRKLSEFFEFGPGKCQLHVSGRSWQEESVMQPILSLVPDVLVLFEDALEASFHRDVKLDFELVLENQKFDRLVGMVANRDLATERVVVVCQSPREVRDLHKKLAQKQVAALPCYSEVGFPMVTRWRVESMALPLLVVDEVMPKLNCGPIDLLIHYSLATSWLLLKKRFTLFFENFRLPPPRRRGHSVIFLLENCGEGVWQLCDFLLKHGLPRPAPLLDILSQRHLVQQLQPEPLMLCNQLTAHGDCLRYLCRYRHWMWREEVRPPDHYPTSGEIRFTVLTCNSPAHLSVRLNKDFPTVAFFNGVPMSQLGAQLQRHYGLEVNRHRHPNPNPGEKAVVRNMNRYDRVAILKAIGDGRVAVRLLDSSTDTLVYNASQVYICEKIFQNQPSEAMEVRIAGLESGSLDRFWPEDLRNAVRTQFFRRDSQIMCRREYHAQVQATIHATIFVDNVYDDKGDDLRGFVVKRFSAHQEARCLDKLRQMVQSSRPTAKAANSAKKD
ncbi:putative ATP-dependent RNA helicase SoYb [Drosophila ficusphila]|uniref:putative ATP-dependent RNA helicase SoYb n=1 Tax=Drosophila ficusphila TaxID=30025 RepID=UPI0007E7822D|nr:putative ATP-dependent RNA helicase SoYb [Drosophila ficusphila]